MLIDILTGEPEYQQELVLCNVAFVHQLVIERTSNSCPRCLRRRAWRLEPAT
jgi:hypothetical protein